MALNQFQLVTQYLDKARECLNQIPDNPHRRFSQLVIDIDQATVYLNTGLPKKAIELLNERFPQNNQEINDLLVSVQCLRASAVKEHGDITAALEMLDQLIVLSVSTNLSLGTLMDAWKLSLEYSIECGDKKRAHQALKIIEQIYTPKSSLENQIYLAKAKVNYYKKFLDEAKLLSAYGDFFDMSSRLKEDEDRETAEAINIFMKLSRMQVEMERIQRDGQHLQFVCATDELTGIANRRGWREHLHKTIEESKKNHGTVGLVLLDLDHFKQFNDKYGHLMGDKILCAVAKSLQIDPERFFSGRYGGDEFIIIFSDLTTEAVEEMLDKVYLNLEKIQNMDEFKDLIHITFSAGYVIADAFQIEQESELLEQADQGLYKSKKSNRNCYHGAKFIPGKK